MTKVLVVDDDVSVVKLMRVLLQSENYTVVAATDGKEGLSVLNQEDPDVVLLDINMPVLNGRDFFTRARQDGFPGPIIVCTANDAERVRRELGASAYVTKPFEPEELLATVSRVVG